MRGTGVGYGVNHAEGAKIYIISSSDIGDHVAARASQSRRETQASEDQSGT